MCPQKPCERFASSCSRGTQRCLARGRVRSVALEIRTIRDDEVPQFRASLHETFGLDVEDDPDGDQRFRALVGPEQAWAAFDGPSIVGTAASFPIAIGIPGGSLPIAGLTMVSVRPTHRRRGLLRELMRMHLDDARRRGYAASGLWASEGSIYGRFGYGVAAEHDSLHIRETHTVTVRGSDFDDVDWVPVARARELLPAIYARATADRPGALRRSDAWWHQRGFTEMKFARDGASRRRHVVARRGDEYVGYIVYRHRSRGDDPSVRIIELHAIDTRAEASLWRFALAMDLFHDVTCWTAPTDSVLPLLLADSRRVERTRYDNLWLRIDDVPAALRARRYTADGALRFSVDGTSWELVVEAGQARCTPAPGADLAIDRNALGMLYLGGFAATHLARANLVRGDARAIATADRLFASAVAPWCSEVF